MSKRAKRNRSSSSDVIQPESGRRLLILLPVTPLAAGLLLIFGSVFDMVVWISPPAQALLGGLFVLGSFSAFNAVQKQWYLAAGWLLLGVAIWLGLSWSSVIWIRVLAYTLGGLGLFFLGKEFVHRFQQQQQRQAKKR